MRKKKLFTNEDIIKQIHLFSAKAEKTLEDEKKVKQLLAKVNRWIVKAKDIPVLGKIIDDVMDMVSLVGNYVSGNYREIPFSVIIVAVAALIYVISPIDIVPDWIPVVGYLDDIAVVTLVLELGVNVELEKYRKWKKNKEEIKNSLKAQACILEFKKNIINYQSVAGFFLRDDLDIEALLTNIHEENKPLPCEVQIISIHDKTLPVDKILQLYGDIIEQVDFIWNEHGHRKLVLEREYETFEDDFCIVGGED